MSIVKDTEITGASDRPSTRLRQRERKVLETAESYAPAVGADWTVEPTAQDAALDELAQRLTDVELITPGTVTTTRGDLIKGDAAAGEAERLAIGSANTVLKSDGTDPAWGNIVNANVDAAAAIAYSKLAALTSANILVGSAGNVATVTAVTGDVTISNTGVTAIGAAKVTVGMQGADVMAETTGTISQAQLLAISTPVELVPAPGAGKIIIVDEIELLHTYSTAAYATGADVQIEYATSGDNIALVVDSFVTAGASANAIIKPSTYDLDGSTGTGSGFNVTANANKAVQMTGSDFTNGNVANILKYRVRYHTVTLLT